MSGNNSQGKVVWEIVVIHCYEGGLIKMILITITAILRLYPHADEYSKEVVWEIFCDSRNNDSNFSTAAKEDYVGGYL